MPSTCAVADVVFVSSFIRSFESCKQIAVMSLSAIAVSASRVEHPPVLELVVVARRKQNGNVRWKSRFETEDDARANEVVHMTESVEKVNLRSNLAGIA